MERKLQWRDGGGTGGSGEGMDAGYILKEGRTKFAKDLIRNMRKKDQGGSKAFGVSN